MKKILTIVTLLILLIAIAIPVLAADVTTSISSSSAEAKAGDEITVTIGVNNFTRDGESKAIEGKLEYDTTKLTYQGISYGSGWNGTISGDKTGIALYKTGTVAASENVITLSFKVAEGATPGSTAVAINNISTSSDGDEVTASSSSKTITITKIEDNLKATPEDVGQGNTSQDPTVANKSVDKAGITSIGIGAIVVISVIGIISYIRYRIINF